jgi:formylglycine-generating enzyme required for sulfatase activity
MWIAHVGLVPLSLPASRAWSSSFCLGLALALDLTGCIELPHLVTDGADGAAPSSGASGSSAVSGVHDGMVLVGAVSLDGGAAPAPAAASPTGKDAGAGKGKGEGNNGNGNGNGNGNAGSGNAGTSAPAPPPSPISVPAFWLDAREVSAAAYRGCLDVGGCTAPALGVGCTLDEGLLDHPITCVTVDQARAFCTWTGKRLVTSDEWTAAAAGADGRLYPWGSEVPAAARLNACGSECAAAGMYPTSDGHVRTAPVGAFPGGATPEGVQDLAGNVAEWVDGVLAPTARGGAYDDVARAAVASTSARSGAVAGPSVGLRCAAD